MEKEEQEEEEEEDLYRSAIDPSIYTDWQTSHEATTGLFSKWKEIKSRYLTQKGKRWNLQ